MKKQFPSLLCFECGFADIICDQYDYVQTDCYGNHCNGFSLFSISVKLTTN